MRHFCCYYSSLFPQGKIKKIFDQYLYFVQVKLMIKVILMISLGLINTQRPNKRRAIIRNRFKGRGEVGVNRHRNGLKRLWCTSQPVLFMNGHISFHIIYFDEHESFINTISFWLHRLRSLHRISLLWINAYHPMFLQCTIIIFPSKLCRNVLLNLNFMGYYIEIMLVTMVVYSRYITASLHCISFQQSETTDCSGIQG